MDVIRAVSAAPRLISVRLLITVATLVLLAGSFGSPSGAGAIFAGVPITVTITEFEELDDPDPAVFQGNGDYYAQVSIGGILFGNRSEFIQGPDPEEDPYIINPGWEFTLDYNYCGGSLVPIIVEIWDVDDPIAAPDDRMDLSQSDGTFSDAFELDIWQPGTYPDEREGDGDTEHTGLFEGGERGRVEYTVTGGFFDDDGDGIPNIWEENGADFDCDGTPEIDFPALGAQPDHKDIFVELDYAAGNPPPRQAILDVKEAFAKAPIDAGGITNPDGSEGINLWVDTGDLMEGGTLVGDDLGGGNEFDQSPNTVCDLSSDGDGNGDIDFYEVKEDNFDEDRWDFFHYAVSAVSCPTSPGGQGEQGGNDFAVYSTGDNYPRTFMHELGHNLNLFHGGFEQDKECKPNYISVMNYDHVPGIKLTPEPGVFQYIVDYSPPRFITAAGFEGRIGDLPDLDENNLTENSALGTNGVVNFIYTNGEGEKAQQPLNTNANWDGLSGAMDGLAVNIDDAENDGTFPDGYPEACSEYDCNGDTIDDCPNDLRVLQGHDDWSNIVMDFRDFTDAADTPGNPPHESIDPTDATAAFIVLSLNSTDLEVTKSDSPDPVVAGENLTYNLTVTNNGPNATTGASLTDTLPSGTTFVSASAGCSETLPGTVDCDLGALAYGDSVNVSITVTVDASLVAAADSLPVTIENSATVLNTAGSDGNSANDNATETTTVVAEADLSVTKSDSSDPAVAGQNLTYTITVANAGPSDAGDVEVVDTLPAGVSYVSDTDSCTESPAGTLTCDLGDIASSANKSFDVTVAVDADLVFNAGGPTSLTNSVAVSSPVASDPDSGNNSTSETTQITASADLEILSFAAVSPPTAILLGEDVDITLRKVIRNNGPSAPMDVSLTRTASSGPGASVTPTFGVASSLALTLAEERTVDETFTINCSLPGTYTFTFGNSIAPLDGQDSDPDGTNNTAQTSITVICVVPVAINILPGDDPNPVISDRGGLIPVAVLTTATGEYGLPYPFDATLILPASVRFGASGDVAAGLGASPHRDRAHLEDAYELDQATMDGDTDNVMQFAARDTGLVPGDTEACMYGNWLGPSGETFDFYGCAPVEVK